MAISSVGSSSYQDMKARFDAFRSGKSTLNKQDLQQIKDDLSSDSTKDSKAADGIQQLIDNFSKVDTNGDGISADELKKAADAGEITAPAIPEGGKHAHRGHHGGKGGHPGGATEAPGGAANATDGTTNSKQSDLMGYDLFIQFKKQSQSNAAAAASTASTDTSSSSSASSTGNTTTDLLAVLNKTSKSDGDSDDSSSSSDSSNSSKSSSSNTTSLARAFAQQLFKAYGNGGSNGLGNMSSLLGAGVVG
ncbi:MAG: hypothetical protein HQM09_15565 [Candidatus Riflebacteria bacterium]|nr:hypothetical protein [Candidatus Riflebacteria bacterium]